MLSVKQVKKNFDGESIEFAKASKKEIAAIRRKTAFVFQNFNLFANKTALENVTEGLVIARKMPKDKAVEIGKAALDPELTGEVLEVMRTLASEGRTMLVVTHEIKFARNVSTKVVFMEQGQVVEAGETKQIFENPKEERTKEFLQHYDR